MISFACESCGKVAEVPEKFAGKQGKCRGCGAVLTVPEPAIFEIEAPTVAVPDPRPRITPQPTPTEVILDPVPDPVSVTVPAPIAFNQTIAVVVVGQPKEANALGVASVIVGLLALGGAWAPFFNIATVPLVFVGGVFAAVGALVTLTSKRTGYLWPIAGAITNAVALLLMILVNLILTFFLARAVRGPEPDPNPFANPPANRPI